MLSGIEHGLFRHIHHGTGRGQALYTQVGLLLTFRVLVYGQTAFWVVDPLQLVENFRPPFFLTFSLRLGTLRLSVVFL